LGRRAAINARKRNRRILTISIVVVIIAAVVGVTLIVINTNQTSPYIGKAVSSSVLQGLTGVSDSTLSSIGKPSGVTAPVTISGSALTSGGKPEVVYIGGDYCPYCALERWSLIVALSHFGNFTGLEYMQSSPTDQNPSTPTFTFSSATFTSPYIVFTPVEEFDRSGNTIQALTTDQQNLVNTYDTCASTGQSGGIPFVDIGNQYAINCGAQSTLDLSGQNWTQIASVLNTASNPTAQLIDGAANTLITAICKIDGGQPTSVCSQSYATVTLAYLTPAGQTGQQSLALVSQSREEARWISSASRL
jgi:hypothetical protein